MSQDYLLNNTEEVLEEEVTGEEVIDEEVIDEEVIDEITEEVTDDRDPSGTAQVSFSPSNNCLYHFRFTVAKGSKANTITGGVLNFTLASGFGTPESISPVSEIPNLQFNTATGVGSWSFGTLNATTPSKTIDFDLPYTGDANVTIFNSVGATFTGGTISIQKPGTKTVAKCPPQPPCCESCNADNAVNFPFAPCDDFVEKTVSPVIESKGRILAVDLDFPPVCKNKDIVVGIFVTEVINQKEVPFAHKIIRRPATGTEKTCANDRDCNCVEFMIDDTPATACMARDFKVRTKAHYVDKPTDRQQCQCDACNRP